MNKERKQVKHRLLNTNFKFFGLFQVLWEFSATAGSSNHVRGLSTDAGRLK